MCCVGTRSVPGAGEAGDLLLELRAVLRRRCLRCCVPEWRKPLHLDAAIKFLGRSLVLVSRTERGLNLKSGFFCTSTTCRSFMWCSARRTVLEKCLKDLLRQGWAWDAARRERCSGRSAPNKCLQCHAVRFCSQEFLSDFVSTMHPMEHGQ